MEKRRRIKSCFERVISPSPPPPPPAGDVESAQWAIEQEETRRINGDDGIYSEAAPDEGQFYIDEVRGSIAETRAIIGTLGDNNPILREFLGQAIGEMESSIIRVSDGSVKPQDYYGRRLMQRKTEYAQYMNDVLVDHPIMNQFKEGFPGIDLAGCEALCEGVSVTSNRTDKTECRALAFRRAFPLSTSDLSGRCYLLQVRPTPSPFTSHTRVFATPPDPNLFPSQNAGTCKVEDFASELYTRHIQSEEVCHSAVSEYDNPLCIQLPTTRIDTVRCHSNTSFPSHPTPFVE